MINKYYDQHMHSNFSPDSYEELENYYKLALRDNVEYICTCEHYDVNIVCAHTTWQADYPKLFAYHEKMKEKYPNIKSLVGIEIGYKKNYLNNLIEMSHRYDYDIIQLSIHDNDIIDYYYQNAFDGEEEITMNGYFDQIVDGIKSFDNYDILSHIDFAFKTLKLIKNDAKISKYENRLIEVLKLLIEKNKTLEINSKVQHTIEEIDGDNSHMIYLLNLYKSLGGEKVSLSSDAHQKEYYRSNFDRYMKIIKSCGFDYLCYYIKRVEYKYYI